METPLASFWEGVGVLLDVFGEFGARVQFGKSASLTVGLWPVVGAGHPVRFRISSIILKDGGDCNDLSYECGLISLVLQYFIHAYFTCYMSCILFNLIEIWGCSPWSSLTGPCNFVVSKIQDVSERKPKNQAEYHEPRI